MVGMSNSTLGGRITVPGSASSVIIGLGTVGVLCVFVEIMEGFWKENFKTKDIVLVCTHLHPQSQKDSRNLRL